MRAAILAVVAALPWMAHAGAPPPVTNPYPGIAAAYALTIDGRLTWADATDQRRQPASLAKLLTALVLLESPRWQPEAHVTVSAAAAGIEGSRIGLRQGEVLRAIDLLTGMLVRSGNDACLALVEHDAGSMPAFAERMNRHAAALGMRDSHFVHPCGLDARGQYTTVTAKSPHNARAWNNLGMARAAQCRLESAADAFREASRRAPDDPLPQVNLALLEQGELDVAAHCRQKLSP